MNKNEALKILGFSDSANPQEWELEEKYKEKLRSLVHDQQGKVKEYAEWKEPHNELIRAYRNSKIFMQFIKVPSKPSYYLDLDDEVNSVKDLRRCLYGAVSNRDIEYARKIFLKFKSSKNERFGDYINEFDGIL